MIDVSGLQLSLDAGSSQDQALALREIAQQLGVSSSVIRKASLLKRSVDARKKSNVHFIATYRLELADEEEATLLERASKRDSKLKRFQVSPSKPYQPLVMPQLSAPAHSPVVVGAGPAGLFAAWYLAKCGLRPLLLEQGAPVEERERDVRVFFQEGTLDPYSNIQFGEGGAGTFSDGKLTTNVKNALAPHVLRWFVDAGAPESILWQAHPHLGSDNLPRIVANIRNSIIQLGGTVRFHAQLIGLSFNDGQLRSAKFRDTRTGEASNIPCETLILACGHSARDTFELVRDSGLVMEQKPFSMGVRIEHPQAFIDEAQWGSAADHPALEAAEYKLAIHLPSGRSVYSFCMCPGGEVVAAASEVGGIVTNGMSDHARAGKNANAALLVNVDPSDLESDDALAGVELQRSIEQRAYQVAFQEGGEPYQAPAQTVGSFLACNARSASAHGGFADGSDGADGAGEAKGGAIGSEAFCVPTYERGVVEASLDTVLPSFITDALREALPLMGKKIRGFDDPRAIMTAPETRSSSPVRIRRDESLQAYFSEMGPNMDARSERACSGLYPCGEGPGFAGGIMSAALDGLKVAGSVAKRYQEEQSLASTKEKVQPATLDQVVQALRAGEPALFPTDTVYGLGVAVNAVSSPEVLYRLKGRSEDKPIAWLVGDVRDLALYGRNVPSWASDLAHELWPGPLTLVVEASDAVPTAFRASAGTIALRMPDHATARSLIAQVGPIATTSANVSGQPAVVSFEDLPASMLAEVRALRGETSDQQASCVIDCTRAEPRILRAGPIDPAQYLGRDKEQS